VLKSIAPVRMEPRSHVFGLELQPHGKHMKAYKRGIVPKSEQGIPREEIGEIGVGNTLA
jgi:hypothetical protein